MKKMNFLETLLVVLVVCAVMSVPIAPALAYNVEMLDEMDLGIKVKSDDIIFTSKHIDLGAEIGAFNLENSDTAKASTYAMGVVSIKGFSIINSIMSFFLESKFSPKEEGCGGKGDIKTC